MTSIPILRCPTGVIGDLQMEAILTPLLFSNSKIHRRSGQARRLRGSCSSPSNLGGAIDGAFSSRADLVVTIDLPIAEACEAILLDTLDRIARVYPKIAQLRGTPQITKAAALAVGLNARRIRKAVPSALAVTKQITSNPESLTADNGAACGT